MTLRIIYGLFMTLIITACTGGGYSESSPYFNIPAGTKIIVKQKLKILPNTGRVYLQYGKVVSPSDRDQYEYNCWFLSWKIKETVQTIEPGTFTVTNTRHTDFLVKSLYDRRLMLASSNEKFNLVSGAATATEYTTELSIFSEKQPDIRRLVCSYWGDPGYGKQITVPEMRAVLGDIVKIKIWQPAEGKHDVQ